MDKSQRIYRTITKFLTLEKHITIYLECGHSFMDQAFNKWNVGDKVSCRQCLSDFKMLEMFVTEDDI